MNQPSISDIVKLHRSVSEDIKTYETLSDEYMPIEVSNELRYAFRAIIDYLDDKKKDEQYDLTRVHYAIRCASFDLIDGLIITVYEYIKELLEKYPSETIEVIDDIMNTYEYIDGLNQKISQSRGGSQEEKLLIYKELHKNEFKILSSHYKKLKLSYPIIEKISIEKESQEKKLFFIAIAGFTIGIIGIIFSIVQFIVN